jgi:hypothetical protein
MARENYKVPPGTTSDSDDLLRIIHKGIDDIIVKLKQAVDAKGGVGAVGDIDRTNDAVKKIVEVFTLFQKGVEPINGQMKEKVINDNEYKTTVITPNFLTPNGINEAYLQSNLNQSTTTLPEGTFEADILDLNTGINHRTYVDGFYNIDITNDQTPLDTRLKNCGILEQLYIRKHKEIIRIFLFVINLFDKYKYAIKVILFLLKNLVRAEQSPGKPDKKFNVRLPLPFITNINLLLKDQANIQTIIDGMENVVNETQTSINNNPNVVNNIEQNLQESNSPPRVSQQQPQA